MTPETQPVDGKAEGLPARDNPPAYAIGRNRPPLASRWAKGVSGNPHGRPRVGPSGFRVGRSVLPHMPDMERALRRPVETAYAGEDYQQVSLVEMLVNELTHMVTVRHNVAAARELLHWVAETERGRAEREAEAAEEAEAARAAEEAAREAEAEAARRREEAAQREALDQLKALSVSDHDEDCDGDCDGACFEETEDMMLIDRALVRLGAGVADEAGSVLLQPWVVEAALARAPDIELADEEKAALALVTAEALGPDGTRSPDWVERLAGVQGVANSADDC